MLHTPSLHDFVSIKRLFSVKHLLSVKHLVALLFLCVSQLGYANSNGASNKVNTQEETKTFYLNIWAPDQVAPTEAKPVEYGVSYQYQYTPESHEIQSVNDSHRVVFKLHPDVKHRYQFRWISADQPQFVQLAKVKKRKITVDVDAVENNEDIYFELWVYDTLTGEVVMCDPRIRIRV